MSPVTRQRQIRPSPGSRRALAEAGTDLPQRPDGLDLFFHLAQDVGDADSQAFWARVPMKETSAPPGTMRAARPQPDGGGGAGRFPGMPCFVSTFESGGRFLFDGSLMRLETWSHVHRNDLTQHCIGSGRLASESGVSSDGSRRPWVGYFDRVGEIAAT